jgi:hypothetical protein
MDSFGYNLTSNNKAIIKRYLASSNTSIIIPSKLFGNDVIALDDNAFYGELKFTGTVEIQNGVKTIGSYAFATCKNLKKLIIPASVEEIKDGAFANCESLEEVRFMGNMPKIGNDLFKNTMFVNVMYFVSARGWDGSVFAGRLTHPMSETNTYMDESEDDYGGRNFRGGDGEYQEEEHFGGGGGHYEEGELVQEDALEEDLFQYEEPQYMDEVNVFNRIGVGSMANTSLKNVSNPIEAFRLRLSGVFNKVKQSSRLTEADLAILLEPIAVIENIKFKNPAGYLIGYVASEKGYKITEKGYKTAFDLLDLINDAKSEIITPADIIRYAVFWISVRTNYIN